MSLKGLVGAAVFSMSPVSEMRLGMPFAIALGSNPYLAFLVAVCFNILTIPLVFLFLDHVHGRLMKINFYNKIFNLYLDRVRKKAEGKIVDSAWPYVGLFFFIGIPLPGTGVWTGSLVSWFFKLNRKKSFITLALGSILAGIIILLVTLGVVKLF